MFVFTHTCIWNNPSTFSRNRLVSVFTKKTYKNMSLNIGRIVFFQIRNKQNGNKARIDRKMNDDYINEPYIY